MLRAVRGKSPQLGEGVFLAETAQLLGDVRVGDRSSIWYQTVLRGDVEPIIIGSDTNIQDGTVIHGTMGKCGAVVGNRVTIGHGVILHGCQVEDLCLIGMGSIIMDQAHIPPRCVVGAGSLVTEGASFEEGMLILGRPAKAVRLLKESELAFLDRSANNYLLYKTWY